MEVGLGLRSKGRLERCQVESTGSQGMWELRRQEGGQRDIRSHLQGTRVLGENGEGYRYGSLSPLFSECVVSALRGEGMFSVV